MFGKIIFWTYLDLSILTIPKIWIAHAGHQSNKILFLPSGNICHSYRMKYEQYMHVWLVESSTFYKELNFCFRKMFATIVEMNSKQVLKHQSIAFENKKDLVKINRS